MSKQQIAFFAGTLLLVVALYSFGRTKPLLKKGAEQEAQLAELTDESVLAAARSKLDSTQRQWLADLEQQKATASASDIAQEIEVLKLMSRTWNEWKNFAAGGFYAEQVAALSANNAEAWSIAGSTYGIAYNRNEDVDMRRWAARKAIKSFQKAAELEPDTLRHQINEAVMKLDLSSVDNTVMPMEGVTQLRKLDEKYPNNLNIILTLGRLSLARTGDVQKAIPRFEKIVEMHQKDSSSVGLEFLLEAHFSLADCYGQLNQKEKALAEYDICIALAPDEEIRKEVIARKTAYQNKK